MSDPPNVRVHAERRSNRDRSIALGVVAVSVLMVVGLWLVSRNSESAVQQVSVSLVTSGVTGEQGCANFATFWTTDSGVYVPVESIEGLTNCRLSEEGTWFVPDGPDDPRLAPRSVPTPEQVAATADLNAALLTDLNVLMSRLPASLEDSLAANYDEVNQPVFGHTKRGRTDLTVKRNRYARITQALLIDPDRIVLADYVGWVMARRTAAIDSFEASCFADPDLGFVVRACRGMRNEFAVSQIPLYWDLADPVLINEYLISSAEDPLLVPEPTADSTT